MISAAFGIALLEIICQLAIQIAVHPVWLNIIVYLPVRLNDCFYRHHRLTTGSDRLENATGNSGENGIPKQASLFVHQGNHREVTYIRLDLIPQVAARSAPHGPDLMDLHPGPFDELQVLPEHEGHPLQQGADEMSARVA